MINTACSTLSSSHEPPETDGNDTDRSIHEWVSSSPFQKPAPEQLVAAVRSALQASNEEFSTQCGDVLAGWNYLQVLDLVHTSTQVASPGLIDSACWEVLPSSNWFESPLGRRAALGHDLLNIARQKASAPCASMIPPPSSDRPDLWESPFTVGFLSVGFFSLLSNV